jgi:hypothetical protein
LAKEIRFFLLEAWQRRSYYWKEDKPSTFWSWFWATWSGCVTHVNGPYCCCLALAMRHPDSKS